jgi:DivIVA domain-containing protein
MDLTPQTLRDVEFREKLRGYHPDDVDDFLEEAAVALE